MVAESDQPNSSTMLAKLLNQLNLPTLAMILLMGGGNWFATKEDGRLTREDAQRVVNQIRDLHNALDGFESRQKDALAKAGQSIEAQGQLLRNQTTMLDNQHRVLTELHAWQQRFKQPE